MTIPVAGLSRFSTVDWPGQLVATVFTQGCSWRCPYCHNPELQAIRAGCVRGGGPVAHGSAQPVWRSTQSAHSSAVPWDEVVDFARTRAGMLDGFVFSGGEPTRHRGLVSAMEKIRELGFRIGLHTNGMYPGLLRTILSAGVVDWVGLDIKAGPEPTAYAVAIGRPGHPGRLTEPELGVSAAPLRNPVDVVWQSLEAVQEWSAAAPGREFEVRTTLFDDSRVVTSLPSLASDLAARGIGAPTFATSAQATAGSGRWALQQVRDKGTCTEFHNLTGIGAHTNWDEVINEIRQICPGVLVR